MLARFCLYLYCLCYNFWTCLFNFVKNPIFTLIVYIPYGTQTFCNFEHNGGLYSSLTPLQSTICEPDARGRDYGNQPKSIKLIWYKESWALCFHDEPENRDKQLLGILDTPEQMATIRNSDDEERTGRRPTRNQKNAAYIVLWLWVYVL